MKFLNKYLDKLVRPKARLKIGNKYTGEKHSAIAQGYVMFKQFDKQDSKYYYWEEWEVTGLGDYDVWIELDHYSREVTLYEPVRSVEKYNVKELVKGQTLTVTIDNYTYLGDVKEVGTGEVVRLEGKMSYQLFPDDVINYAEVNVSAKRGSVLSIEDYRQVGDTDYDYYIGRVLSRKEQKAMFGKVIGPRRIGVMNAFFIAFISFTFIGPFIPQYETVCTPRTAVPSSSSISGTSPSADSGSTGYSSTDLNGYNDTSNQGQSCQRVRVYGSGGSGAGK